jgi:hypothetical protein
MGSYQSVELPTNILPPVKEEVEKEVEKEVDSEAEVDYVYVITHNKTIVGYADDFEEMLKHVKKMSRNLMREYFLKDPLGHYNLYEYNIDELEEDNLAYQARIFYRRRGDWMVTYEKIEDTIRVFAVDKIESEKIETEDNENETESETEVEETETESEENEKDTEKLD